MLRIQRIRILSTSGDTSKEKVFHKKYFSLGFSDYTLIDSRPVDFDLNYFDGTPIVGLHPILDNIFMATGFNGRGPTYGPAVGRGIAELLLDDGYQTIDFSR